MILYHGSNIAVEKPEILKSDRKLDFGEGFYMTSSYEQAKRWAELTTKRRGEGKPTVTSYEFDENNIGKLNILHFKSADASWLEFVSKNRNNEYIEDDYDIVIGKVANDKTMPVISLYFAGVYNIEETIKRLLPQNLKDQYSFKTQKALDYLLLKEVIIHE